MVEEVGWVLRVRRGLDLPDSLMVLHVRYEKEEARSDTTVPNSALINTKLKNLLYSMLISLMKMMSPQ